MSYTIKLPDGRQLGYSIYGDPKGKPLFYFHGWPGSRLMAKPLNDTAQKLHIEIIAVDRPGYGLSDFKDNRSLLDWADDILELADTLEIDTFAIMGVSGGAPYATACAYKIPKRITKVGIIVGLAPTDVKGVLQGMAFFNRLAWQYYQTFPFLMQLSSVISLLNARKYLPDYFNFAYRSKADQWVLASSTLKKDIANSRAEAFKQGKKGAAMDLKLYTGDWGFNLSNIKIPVYLWYGDTDKNVSPRMGEYYHDQIRGSRLTIYKNEGHLLMHNHADEILKELVVFS